MYTVPQGGEKRDIFFNSYFSVLKGFNLRMLTPFLFLACIPVTMPGTERNNCKQLRYSSDSRLSGTAGAELAPYKGLVKSERLSLLFLFYYDHICTRNNIREEGFVFNLQFKKGYNPACQGWL